MIFKVLDGKDLFTENENGTTIMSSLENLESKEMSLISNLLNHDVTERYTYQQTKAHPYFNDVDFNQLENMLSIGYNRKGNLNDLLQFKFSNQCVMESGGFSNEFEYA